MDITILSLSFIASLGSGSLLGLLAYRIHRFRLIKAAELSAQELIEEAKEAAEMIDLELKEKQSEIEEELWSKEEAGIAQIEAHIEELQELAEEKANKNNQKVQSVRDRAKNQEEQAKGVEQKLKALQQKLEQKKTDLTQLNTNLITQLSQKLSISKETLIQQLVEEMKQEADGRTRKIVEWKEEDAKTYSEHIAKEILNRALTRFHRPYCPERGISSVHFENDAQRKVLCDPAGANVKLIAELTGCDVIVENDQTLVAVLGFDPVRRELTRRILERILKEKKPVNVDFIRRTHDNIKRELLATIKRDGDALAKELKMEGLHPEIRQIMGSLRYRYSFTQNQYFHCGEVGWLCGLLALELGSVDYRNARRSGMLHDLGKALDHEMDGGHAVIGANFIEPRGEKPEVVHAVRAHHYDEQPNSDMAYLVIAADAISGARPGARRSTVESYEQKVNELENIAKSYQGVTDCFVLNGGRELRVLVNSKVLDDQKALVVGREMAHRIENELSYPGQIKVVVVRETLVYENTRAH